MKVGKKLTTLALAGLVLSGCQTFDPYTGESKTSNAAKVGGISALVCGLIGATKNKKHARNAAFGCGVIGASIGAYMDAQEKELRQELESTGVRVQRNGDQIQLIMPGNITFATNKHDIRSDFYPVLNSVAKVLYKFQDTNLVIVGHTDSTGSDDHNMQLSQRRASSVSAYLSSQGVSYQRLKSYGQGENSPIASNQTDAGRAQNRRVELTITPIQE